MTVAADDVVPRRGVRKMLRAVEAGIDVADGTYPAFDGDGRTAVTTSDLHSLGELRYYGYITGGLTVTDKGRDALHELRRRWLGLTPSTADITYPPDHHDTETASEPGPEVLDRTTCVSSKVRFGSHADGAAWVGRYRKTKRATAPRLRLYECPMCAGWHVSKKRHWAPRKAKGSWT